MNSPPAASRPATSSTVCWFLEMVRRHRSAAIIAIATAMPGWIKGDSAAVKPMRAGAQRLPFDGTADRQQRVKLTNVKDCVKRGLFRRARTAHVAADS